MKYKKFKKKPRWKRKRQRRYLEPVAKCVKLNDKFPGSNFHHLSTNIGIYIPEELHRHISHSLKSHVGMVEMNLLAMQYLYGHI